jgi:hypothetical protein
VRLPTHVYADHVAEDDALDELVAGLDDQHLVLRGCRPPADRGRPPACPPPPFAAMEQPGVFVEDLMNFARAIRR